MTTYTTISGDTWDKIAKKVYNDDHAFEAIIDNNIEHADTLIFGAGVELNIPDSATMETSEVKTDQALWREDMN